MPKKLKIFSLKIHKGLFFRGATILELKEYRN